MKASSRFSVSPRRSLQTMPARLQHALYRRRGVERIEFGAPVHDARVVEAVAGGDRDVGARREGVSPERAEQFADGHLYQNASVIHDDTVVHELFHVLNDVRGKENGLLLALRIVAQVFYEQAAVTGVQSHREVVKHEQIGVLGENQP